MKNYCVHCLSLLLFLGLSGSVSAQDTLVFSAIENTPPATTVGEVLRQAYQKLGIQVTLQEYPGLRGLAYSNEGTTDGEAFRVAGIEKEYPNLIQVEVPVRFDHMHLFVKQGKEFVIEGWGSIPKEYIIGYLRGLKFAEYAIVEHGLQAEAVSSVEQLFLKLDAGRNDVILTGVEDGARWIQQLELHDIVRLDPPIQTNKLYHYLHVKHADLVPKITAVLKEMEANGEIQQIRAQIEAEMSQ